MQPAFVYSTVPTVEEAEKITRILLDEKRIACANLLPGMRALYRWQGKIEQTEECVLLLKTIQAQVPALIERIAVLHSYDCPCIVQLPLGECFAPYVAWLSESVESPGEPPRIQY